MLQTLITGSRLLLGLIFFVFGINGFLEFFPVIDGLNPKALNFMTNMQNSYLFGLVKSIEVFCGILLLSNQFIPLALIFLAPIIVNIFTFHVVLQPSELLIASAVLLLEIILIITHADKFKSLLSRK